MAGVRGTGTPGSKYTPTPPPNLPFSGDVHVNLAEVEDFLAGVRDNRRNSESIRLWALQQLDHLAEMREYARDLAAAEPSRAERLAAALKLDRVPEMTKEQEAKLDAAIRRAEADADRIYGSSGQQAAA